MSPVWCLRHEGVACGVVAVVVTLLTAACRRPATLQPRTLLARRPLRAHDGTDGGDLAPGEPTSMRALCTCPGLQGFWWRSVSDLGAAACGEAELTKRPAASQLATAATRSLQPPPCPLSERRTGRPTHHFTFDVGLPRFLVKIKKRKNNGLSLPKISTQVVN